MKKLGDALFALWTLRDVKHQETLMVATAILAPERNVVRGHGFVQRQLISPNPGVLQERLGG